MISLASPGGQRRSWPVQKDESMNEIRYKPIGVVHSPFREPKGTPIQPAGAKGINGTVEIFQQYAEGLKDIEGFSHIILLYHFHLSKGSALIVKPYMDSKARGVFAMRGPSRPNPIGISVVRLIKVEGNRLHIRDVDIVDGTPLLDIKPYVPEFDIKEVGRIGWLEGSVHKLSTSKDDGRFTD
jgi:tRNA-Thr(GGU) m(6)t(6)A37 methyltransferase TsaA